MICILIKHQGPDDGRVELLQHWSLKFEMLMHVPTDVNRNDMTINNVAQSGSTVEGIWLASSDGDFTFGESGDASPYYCEEDSDNADHNNCILTQLSAASDYDTDCCKAWAHRCRTNKAFSVMGKNPCFHDSR